MSADLLARALAVLRANEWSGRCPNPLQRNPWHTEDYVSCCPECEAIKPGPHEADCESRAVLDAAKARAVDHLPHLQGPTGTHWETWACNIDDQPCTHDACDACPRNTP